MFNRIIDFSINKKSIYTTTILLFFLIAPTILNAQQDSAKMLQLNEAVHTALNNNPIIKNSELQIKASKAQKQGILDFKPLEFEYQKGQLYSALTDHSWEVNQNFGSILTHIQKAKYVKQTINLSEKEYEITIKKITLEVKSAYYYWIYLYNKYRIIAEQEKLYDDFLRIANLHFEAGESSLLEKTIAETKSAEIKNQLFKIEDDLEIAENKLLQLMAVEEFIIPPTTELNIYEIPLSTDTSSERFSNTILVNYYENIFNLKNTNFKVEKASYFPEISLGYFYQDIKPLYGLTGWNIGISFPLWFFPQNAKIQQTKVQKLMAQTNFQYQKFKLKKDIETLEIELNKYFNQLIYYRKNALKQADILIHTATAKFKNEDIEYMEYIHNITTALEIKLNYLEALNAYNQTAIKLEFYVN